MAPLRIRSAVDLIAARGLTALIHRKNTRPVSTAAESEALRAETGCDEGHAAGCHSGRIKLQYNQLLSSGWISLKNSGKDAAPLSQPVPNGRQIHNL